MMFAPQTVCAFGVRTSCDLMEKTVSLSLLLRMRVSATKNSKQISKALETELLEYNKVKIAPVRLMSRRLREEQGIRAPYN